MADHLSEPPSTVQSWKTCGRIPAHKQASVLQKAEELGLPVTAEDIVFPLGRVCVHNPNSTICSPSPSFGKADELSDRVSA
ncbi:carph-isopro domain-containing protein [Sphingomonas parapaucimobilis]|uniref:carph-isopro domain-containing protein n=1 Tax=Sphingomonas parapaucimobilis TaxID=28213 RepID=UPI0035C7DB0E